MIRAKIPLPTLFLAITLTGCAHTIATDAGAIHERNSGYSLLDKLMNDEKDVGKIFIFKHADDSVGNLVREIGNFCGAASKELDDFAKADPQLRFDEPDLPKIEQKSRDLQASDDENALLFSSGTNFEKRLIFTQAQATNYARQLARALTDEETDPARKKFLENMATQCAEYHDRLMALLIVKS
jgi:hypothetical protein